MNWAKQGSVRSNTVVQSISGISVPCTCKKVMIDIFSACPTLALFTGNNFDFEQVRIQVTTTHSHALSLFFDYLGNNRVGVRPVRIFETL